LSAAHADLGALADDLREIGDALNQIAAHHEERDRAIVYQVSISAPCVLTILYVRRLRTQFIGDVPDPLWWMMLRILATRLDGGRLSLKELSEACGLSRRTTARWARRLEKAGFVEFHAPTPKAEPLVDLTEQAASRIQHYLDAALQISPWLL
jgi:DNA-binding transcriptional ArsR family regulator